MKSVPVICLYHLKWASKKVFKESFLKTKPYMNVGPDLSSTGFKKSLNEFSL